MFNSDIDINCIYFHMPFGPTTLNYKELGLMRTLEPNVFIDIKNHIKWKACKLYDTGWGKPNGFERIPELMFNDLIKLALLSDYRTSKIPIQSEESNKYGAIAVILDRHSDEMISFLNDNINNPLIKKDTIIKNLSLFCNESLNQNSNCKIIINLINKIIKEF